MLTISLRSVLAAAALMGALGAAQAEQTHFMAKLDGASETPPNSTKGVGTVEADYDSATKTLTYTATYSDLTGPATMAHFHGPAPEGKAAGVMVPISGALASPIKGSATLTDDQAKALMDGMVYFNVHTAANKAGEIRGQLTKGM
jgi:hypothetical protein